MTKEEYCERLNDINQLLEDGEITEDEAEDQRGALAALKIQSPVYAAMNEEGDMEVGLSPQDAIERLSNRFGGELVHVGRADVRMTPPVSWPGSGAPIEISETSIVTPIAVAAE